VLSERERRWITEVVAGGNADSQKERPGRVSLGWALWIEHLTDLEWPPGGTLGRAEKKGSCRRGIPGKGG